MCCTHNGWGNRGTQQEWEQNSDKCEIVGGNGGANSGEAARRRLDRVGEQSTLYECTWGEGRVGLVPLCPTNCQKGGRGGGAHHASK